MKKLIRRDIVTGEMIGKPTMSTSETCLNRTAEALRGDDKNKRARNKNQNLIRAHFDEVGWHRYVAAYV